MLWPIYTWQTQQHHWHCFDMAFGFRPPKVTQKILPVKPPKGHFFFAGRAFERVKWWKLPQLRKLYAYIVILILTNTANGFDGYGTLIINIEM